MKKERRYYQNKDRRLADINSSSNAEQMPRN